LIRIRFYWVNGVGSAPEKPKLPLKREKTKKCVLKTFFRMKTFPGAWTYFLEAYEKKYLGFV
jgi:hypothetical protein